MALYISTLETGAKVACEAWCLWFAKRRNARYGKVKETYRYGRC